MRLDEALARLTHAIATAPDERAKAVRTCLRRGAGLIGLPAGAEFGAPAGLMPDRRELWISLVDALRIDAVGVDGEWDAAADWSPVHAGDWESVLGTLLIEGEWAKIEETAEDLRRSYPDSDDAVPEPAWRHRVREVADILSASRDTFRSRQIQRAREILDELLEAK